MSENSKSELDIKEEEFREKSKLESEKLIKLLQLDLEQFVNVEDFVFNCLDRNDKIIRII